MVQLCKKSYKLRASKRAQDYNLQANLGIEARFNYQKDPIYDCTDGWPSSLERARIPFRPNTIYGRGEKRWKRARKWLNEGFSLPLICNGPVCLHCLTPYCPLDVRLCKNSLLNHFWEGAIKKLCAADSSIDS